MNGETARARILVLELTINQCGTSSNPPPHMQPPSCIWRGKQRIYIIGSIMKQGTLGHIQWGNQ